MGRRPAIMRYAATTAVGEGQQPLTTPRGEGVGCVLFVTPAVYRNTHAVNTTSRTVGDTPRVGGGFRPSYPPTHVRLTTFLDYTLKSRHVVVRSLSYSCSS